MYDILTFYILVLRHNLHKLYFLLVVRVTGVKPS